MIRYRLSVEDDELDDYEEGSHINVDDDMGDYGVDDEDDGRWFSHRDRSPVEARSLRALGHGLQRSLYEF